MFAGINMAEKVSQASNMFAGMTGDPQTHNIGGLEWVIDSGATDHFIANDKIFESFV